MAILVYQAFPKDLRTCGVIAASISVAIPDFLSNPAARLTSRGSVHRLVGQLHVSAIAELKCPARIKILAYNRAAVCVRLANKVFSFAVPRGPTLGFEDGPRSPNSAFRRQSRGMSGQPDGTHDRKPPILDAS